MLPTKEQIETIVKELQRIMRIQDWDVEISIISRLEMLELENGDNCCGVCERDIHHRIAIIYLNKDHGQMQDDKNWYFTLIHEMYHINTTLLIDRIDSVARMLNNKDLETYIVDFTKQEYEKTMNEFAKIFTSLYPVSNFDCILKPKAVS